jgi:hypothetical protein
MAEEARDSPAEHDRWALLRDILVFQFKLIVDGFRDLLLVPVSLVAGLFSLLRGGSRPGPEFYDLLKMGQRSERWINLFGAADRTPDADDDRSSPVRGDIDDLVRRLETFVVDEYRSGGITAQARSRLDSALAALRASTRRSSVR